MSIVDVDSRHAFHTDDSASGVLLLRPRQARGLGGSQALEVQSLGEVEEIEIRVLFVTNTVFRAKEDLEEGVAKSGRKKKLLEHIGYDEFEKFNEGDLGKISALLKTPKKSVKLIDKTMKGWNRERSTLPEDLHYSGHELVSLIFDSRKCNCSTESYFR